MYIGTEHINLCIIGKPNSGKSTLFNTLLGSYLSPVGEEYGLTKSLYKKNFRFKNYNFTIIDTPGLRRRSKVEDKSEISRNAEVIKLLNKVEVIILLIDSIEFMTKQDFKLADLAINNNKIVFFLFNKIDIVDDKKTYKSKTLRYFKNNYSQFRSINVDFISAKKNLNINKTLNAIIKKIILLPVELKKEGLKKFVTYLIKKGKLPKIKNIEIKPKYIVQTKGSVPTFKVFINTHKKAPKLFIKYFDNSFRHYFKLDGIPIVYYVKSSKNPYIN